MTTEIAIDLEGPSAKAVECMLLSVRYSKNAKWTKGKELYEADGRVFIKVTIATPRDADVLKQYKRAIDMSKQYFMDAITGTLYREDGRCLTTTQIKTRQFVRNDKLCTKLLSEKRAA